MSALAFLGWWSAEAYVSFGRTYHIGAVAWGGLAACLLGLLLAKKSPRFSRTRHDVLEAPLGLASAVTLALFAAGLIVGTNLGSNPLATLGAAYAPVLPTIVLLTAMSAGLFLFGLECIFHDPAAGPRGAAALLLGSIDAAVALSLVVVYVVTMIASFVLIS